jgi:hypothetical protein
LQIRILLLVEIDSASDASRTIHVDAMNSISRTIASSSRDGL